jgi:hypothetical protein
MYAALSKNLPIQISVAALLKGFSGDASSSDTAAVDATPEDDEQVLRMFSQ